MSLGPGGRGYMAPEALEAVKAAGIIAGYKMYLDLIDDLLDGKEIIESGMKKEVDRCAAAIDRAVSGALQREGRAVRPAQRRDHLAAVGARR